MKNDVFWVLRRVALVRTDVSEEHIASISRVTRISELEATLAVTRKRRTLRRATWRNIPEDGIPQISDFCHQIFVVGTYLIVLGSSYFNAW
jgi:hypothetical protein